MEKKKQNSENQSQQITWEELFEIQRRVLRKHGIMIEPTRAAPDEKKEIIFVKKKVRRGERE